MAGTLDIDMQLIHRIRSVVVQRAAVLVVGGQPHRSRQPSEVRSCTCCGGATTMHQSAFQHTLNHCGLQNLSEQHKKERSAQVACACREVDGGGMGHGGGRVLQGAARAAD